MSPFGRVLPLYLGSLMVGLTCLPARAADPGAEATSPLAALADRLAEGLVDVMGGKTAARVVTVPRVAASDAVQAKLKLTDEEKRAVADIINPPPELIEAQLKRALGDRDFSALQRLTAGLQLRIAGPAAVVHEPTATVLKLTPDQRKRMQAVADEYDDALGELLPFGSAAGGGLGGLRGINVRDIQAKRLALQEASNRVAGDLLTQSQRDEIKKLMEEAADIEIPTSGLQALTGRGR